MITECKQTHGSKLSGNQKALLEPFRDTPAQAQELEEQCERLEALKACEQEIEALERRRSELEVECIERDARLKRIAPPPRLDQSQLAEIGDALHKMRELQAALKAHTPQAAGQGAAVKELEQLKTGLDALVAWLDAPNATRPQPIVKFAYLATLVVTLVVIWSALFIHPVLLLVLLGLGVVLAFLRSFNQNEDWVRLGAKRHFDATDLEPPSRWDDASVHERMVLLETRIKAVEAAADRQIQLQLPEQDEQDELERKEVEFAMAQMHLTKLMVEAGLEIENLDEPVKQWLDYLSEARHSRRELERITGKIKAVDARRGDVQERLFRFLARQGEAPEGGAADWASLAAGLERLAERAD